MIRKSEEIVYRAVSSGKIRIDKNGTVWRGNKRAEHVATGYLQVRVMERKVRSHACAHRLVWRHFFGTIPDGMTINHKNGIKTDNRPENLELATYVEQQIHASRVLKVGHACRQHGEANSMAKLTAEQVAEIRIRRKSGERLKTIAQDYGITDRAVSKIALGQRWVLPG